MQEKEQREQDEARRAEEALQSLDLELTKSFTSGETAAAGMTSLTRSFVRRLPAEKRREAQIKVNRALAQLADARRVRLMRFSAFPAPAALKPPTSK